MFLNASLFECVHTCTWAEQFPKVHAVFHHAASQKQEGKCSYLDTGKDIFEPPTLKLQNARLQEFSC